MAHMLVSSEKLTLAEKALLFWDEMLALGILSEACCHGLCEREQKRKMPVTVRDNWRGQIGKKVDFVIFKKERERERKKGKMGLEILKKEKTAFVLRGLEFWFWSPDSWWQSLFLLLQLARKKQRQCKMSHRGENAGSLEGELARQLRSKSCSSILSLCVPENSELERLSEPNK